jgi:hypothetical protein
MLQNRKLGKKAKKEDPRTFKLANFLKAPALPPVPEEVHWGQFVLDIGMMRNDEIGLCVVAGKAHQIQSWTASKGTLWRPTDQQIVDTYVTLSALDGTPYDPVTGANDDGLAILDALNYWRTQGLWGHKIGAFAEVDAHNPIEVRTAIALFGGVTVGVGLPVSAQDQEYWQVDDLTLSGDAEKYSWGGHDMYVSGYDKAAYKFWTWGASQLASVPWWDAYVDECYVCLSDDWVTGTAPAPNGFDLPKLQAALAAL